VYSDPSPEKLVQHRSSTLASAERKTPTSVPSNKKMTSRLNVLSCDALSTLPTLFEQKLIHNKYKQKERIKGRVGWSASSAQLAKQPTLFTNIAARWENQRMSLRHLLSVYINRSWQRAFQFLPHETTVCGYTF
jgi:hypothetical protein